ncbi:MAG: glutathione S-transferase family protein [Cyanobacteria bacterium P01_D01_bin.71]
MKLYYFPPSPNTRRVHAVALQLQLPVELAFVDLQKSEQQHPRFLQLNPTGRVPVLQDDELVLWESTAIMQYLASQVPNALWPENIALRADIMRWQSWQLAHWQRACQPLQFERVIKQILQLGDPDPDVVDSATANFHREAKVLNEHLASRSYLVAQTLTLADFAVASDLTYAVPGQFPLVHYPHIRAWYERLEQLPAWQQTAPRG